MSHSVKVVRPPRGRLRRELERMQAEFESTRLEVGLAPLNPGKRGYNEGGCKRVTLSVNAKWYRDFCARHLSSRKRNKRHPDTRIKRRNVERLLSRLLLVGSISKYGEELIRIAETRMKARQ